MMIFILLPTGNQQPHSTNERVTLSTYQNQFRTAKHTMFNSSFTTGYGNITGFQLSYDDYISGKDIKDWPIHKFDDKLKWSESEKYSILPDVVSEQVRSFWGNDRVDDELGRSYLLNISGRADGEFKSVKNTKIKPIHLNIPQYLKDYYTSYNPGNNDNNDDNDNNNVSKRDKDYFDKPVSRVGNITKANGVIRMHISGFDYNFQNPEFSKFIYNETTDKIDDAIVTKININLKDYPEIEDHGLVLRGIYFQKLGAMVGVTKSAKFFGDFGLSHLTLNKENFEIANKLMSQFKNITDVEKDILMDDVHTSIVRAQEQCEYISFIQFEKTQYNAEELRRIDQELKKPAGRPIPKDIPQIQVKEFLVYSPDCGILLTNKPNTTFSGLRNETLTQKLRTALVALLVLALFQLGLFLRQMKYSRTPGQLSLISSTSLFILGFGDSTLALIFFFIASISEDLYLIMIAITVVTFIMCCIFEIRFMVSVLTTQANEEGASWWQILRGGVNGPSNASTTDDETGPILPIANPPPAPPAPQANQVPPTNADWQASGISNSIFGIGFTVSIIAMFFIFNAVLWRLLYRKIFEYIGLIFINSYWLPQFFRNTLKNRRKSFGWEFVFGTSIIRLLPIYYVCLYKDNPLRHRFDGNLVIVVTSWVTFQIGLLILQNNLGPRFWINEKWLPQAYDYQQILSLKDLESGFASDILSNIKPQNEESDEDIVQCKSSCPVCMNEVTLPILIKQDNTEARKKIEQMNKEYMVTPCHHIFHSECLENWMKYKLRCPICRESLPPI
ncbi:Transmembrane E3 ubiquitin-protein ligase 1 [Spathaspora sp. JA1]|nr:Transmembrane E3 ubiquitin-protein ligase 1 [Spathaspora sp. JA1]